MLEAAGFIDFNGHASVRLPGDRMLINGANSNRGALTTADLVEIDFDGTRIGGADRAPLEFHIHAAIYRRRPGVQAVVHGHPKWSTVLTIAGHRLKPVYAQGSLLGDVPVFANPLSVNSRPVGDALAETLGEGRAVLLRAHGATVVGADIVECFVLATYLEENAQRQYLATQIGDVYEFPEAERRVCEANLYKPWLFEKAWDYYLAKLGRG